MMPASARNIGASVHTCVGRAGNLRMENASRAWEAAPSDKVASYPATLVGPLGISISPCLADGLLLCWRC
jgi:hypothetical protein